MLLHRARPVRARLILALMAVGTAGALLPSPAAAQMTVSSNASWRDAMPNGAGAKNGTPQARVELDIRAGR